MSFGDNTKPTPASIYSLTDYRGGATSPHTFHIPVMGIGFTIDTPLKVARYGISSVVTIGDDILLEQIREYYCRKNNLLFAPIAKNEPDSRARRITSYLNMLHLLVERQAEILKNEPFESGSDITRYFEMLPEGALKSDYQAMLNMTDQEEQKRLQKSLRQRIHTGSIDVNIMTKIDGPRFRDGVELPPEETTAISAFRGFAESSLHSSVVFSAGMNRHLYQYAAQFDDFLPDENNYLKKKIVLKVSDYRSAFIQGKLMAREGLWISEYRVESGLNCGGHAFPTQGMLSGPILEEFKKNRHSLITQLYEIYTKALKARNRSTGVSPHPMRLTFQGGIGTRDENEFLIKNYDLDGTGWGTPFLLVPEVTNVDQAHLDKLKAAGNDDVHLSDNSPLGAPFWNLRTSHSEQMRRDRIKNGIPGSGCPKGFLALDTELTGSHLCPASRSYQKIKIGNLFSTVHDPKQILIALENIVTKSCLCQDLSGSVLSKLGLGKNKNANPLICCGPGISYYSQISSLEDMVSHIYGRLNILNSTARPHMFIRELQLFADYLKSEIEKASQGLISRTQKQFQDMRTNLLAGIEYYRKLACKIGHINQTEFMNELENIRNEIEDAMLPLGKTVAIKSA